MQAELTERLENVLCFYGRFFMSENVITMKSEKKEKNAEKKLEGFVSKNRKLLLIIFCVLVLAAVVLCVCLAVRDFGIKKGIKAVDSIEYSYTKDSENLSEEEIAERKNSAIAELSAYVSKSGVVGTRANLLAADIYFSQKNYEEALNSYKKAASSSKKAYTSPVACYNAGVCSEELGNLEDAYNFYALACDSEDFYLVSHALFTQGRVAEKLENYENAKNAYSKLVDSYPDDEWTELAQSRLIALKIAGKIN